MMHSRHFLPGVATIEAFFGAITDAQFTAYGAACLALIATAAGIVHDVLTKRMKRREDQAKVKRADQWAEWCKRKRMRDMDAGKPDPFPNGLPPLEHDDDEAAARNAKPSEPA